MEYQLFVDSTDFWGKLKEDLINSKKSIFIQTLSCEGDVVGQELSDILIQKNDIDRRLIMDSFYAHYMINDNFIYSLKNLFNKNLQKEKRETKKMYEKMEKYNIKLKFVNPVGIFYCKIANRNHKKIIVIDSKIAYIGGINFCEHNFKWHDLMVRITDTEITKLFEEDFLITWNGTNQYKIAKFHNNIIMFLDGKHNEIASKKILDLLNNAKKSIFIESPYFSFPFYSSLKRARKRGVDVFIIIPQQNNRYLYDEYSQWEIQQTNIASGYYSKRMNHLKAILIDDECLIMGSSNYDYLSYKTQQEMIVIFNDKKIILDFKKNIEEVDKSNVVYENIKRPFFKKALAVIYIKIVLFFLVYINKKI